MRSLNASSLRWRLIRAISLVVLLVWGMGAYFSYTKAEHEAEELMDGNLAQHARRLLALARHNETDLTGLAQYLETATAEPPSLYESPLEFQLAAADGKLLMRSRHAPETPVANSPGYANLVRDGQGWRVFCTSDVQTGRQAIVFQSMELRDTVALEIATRTALPIGLALPILLALIYYSIRRSLKPLDDLAAEVASRSTGNLAELESKPAPLELQGLAEAINHLLQRLRRTLENERRFTADAAHELRTPLAALKIHAQVALASRDAEQQQHALTQTINGVDRSTRVVEQLLRLARLDPLSRPGDMGNVDLGELAAEVAAAAEGQVERKVVLTLPANAVAIEGDRGLLAVAWRNLLENALRYTLPGGTITVYAAADGGAICIGVADDGPGCPEAELPRLHERFFRSSQARAEGSGLGLAIVSRIAELHGARLELANRSGGGFDARIRWPA
ncbi:ATP-binding protein [Dechloromonas sp. A34]|uniref:ATP-binding protein n=1 Tax=Dechloromonas sp. A34 TaxID=447588 RepID=UPI0022489965|nr:ATP-binding protein [Dechloromonas sp. A34]